jgi:hypothetical protein
LPLIRDRISNYLFATTTIKVRSMIILALLTEVTGRLLKVAPDIYRRRQEPLAYEWICCQDAAASEHDGGVELTAASQWDVRM